MIAYSFSNQLELLSITSLIGTYGFNLFCISLFTSPAIFILSYKNKDIGISIFFLIATFTFYIYGTFYKEKFDKTLKKNFDYKIRVIGSNISLDRFYENIDTGSVIQDLINLSNPNIKDKTIFIWPEGILPNISQKDLVQYRYLFDARFNKNHLLVVGTNSVAETESVEKYYNSLTIYDYKLNILNSYNKVNLVPFGEFLPLENIFKVIGLRPLSNNYQSFSSGNQRNIIQINHQDSLLKILPLICYEIIYSGKLFKDSDFDLIINISEDGWFGKSIGPKQHFVHSIFRAIESGKYVIRSSNNGIAAIINPLGQIEKNIIFGQSGHVDLEGRKSIQPTIFSKFGNKIFLMLILVYIFFIFSFNKFKK